MAQSQTVFKNEDEAKVGVPSQNAAPSADNDLEDVYQRHSHIATQAKDEYANLYRQMGASLSPTHLEPFAKILLDRENHVLQDQGLVDSLSTKLVRHLQNSLDHLWDVCDVPNGITSLEVLKEKFKEFEGVDWKVQEKNPNDRIMSIRMRFKEMRLKYLQKQLDFQAAQLAEISNINDAHRNRIVEISDKRIYLTEAMERQAEMFKEKKPQLLQMQQDLLSKSTFSS